MTSEQKNKQKLYDIDGNEIPKDLHIIGDPYNREFIDYDTENVWLQHLEGKAEVPLAVQPRKDKANRIKKKFKKKHVSNAQRRGLEAVYDEG